MTRDTCHKGNGPLSSRRARRRRSRRASSGSRSRARRTSASSRARARSSTTCAGTAWATSTSSARRTRTRRSSRSTSRRRSSSTACTGRSRATRSRSDTDPFFEMSVEPGGNIKDYALAVGRVRTWASRSRPSARRRASSRATRPSSSRSSTSRCPVLVDAEEALKDEVVLHDDAGSNVVWSGVFDWGDVDAALAEADHVVKIERLHFHRFSSTPLECAGALVEYDKGTGEWTLHCNHQMPGVGAIWMAPALRTGIDKLRFVTQDIGGGFGNKICLHPQYVVLCLLARKLGRPGAVDGVAHRPAHGERARQRAHVPRRRGRREGGRDDDGLQGAALDDCGAFPRYEPLGCIIWAQVTPGLYRGGTSASTSRRSARTSRPSRRTAATRACSTCG